LWEKFRSLRVKLKAIPGDMGKGGLKGTSGGGGFVQLKGLPSLGICGSALQGD